MLDFSFLSVFIYDKSGLSTELDRSMINITGQHLIKRGTVFALKKFAWGKWRNWLEEWRSKGGHYMSYHTECGEIEFQDPSPCCQSDL